MRPFQHLRLILFFAAIGVGGIWLGALRLRALGPDPALADAQWVTGTTVALTVAIGFAGVFFHRLRVQPIRWRETESFLLRIQKENEKYRAILEGAADMLLLVEPESGRVRECNARAREELGIEARPDGAFARSGEQAPLTIDALLEERDREAFRAALSRAPAAPGPAFPLPEVKIRAVRGRTLTAAALLAAIEVEGRRVIQVSLRDLTAQKEMERELQIRERLSSIGLLTAGVAHEINNPLEGIGNYLTLLEREGATDEQRARHLEAVRHGFTRIRDIVRDLLRFARPSTGQGVADLSEVVARATKLVAYSEKMKGVAIDVRGLDVPRPVVGDPGRLEQVVVNLLLNAAQAMSSRGRIVISAREHSGAGSRAVELSVEDEGPGIPAQDLERVFDPFFTTSGGTGLGLSVSYGIVRAHGGTLTAENRSHGGARFTIRLPWPGDRTSGLQEKTDTSPQ